MDIKVQKGLVLETENEQKCRTSPPGEGAWEKGGA